MQQIAADVRRVDMVAKQQTSDALCHDDVEFGHSQNALMDPGWQQNGYGRDKSQA
jgi:hypothetical protein